MTRFSSILFPHQDATANFDATPDCFPDLHLNEIVAAVTAGRTDGHFEKFFYAPLHEVSSVEYRHQVFRDLDRTEVCQPIENLVDRMRSTTSTRPGRARVASATETGLVYLCC
jgi:DNA mismatch repair protein MutS